VSPEASKKKELEELRNAEKKYQSIIEKRNELNNMGKLLRDERDMINDKRKELKDDMHRYKKERDELVTEMKKHKELRNQYQQQAKALIATKQKKRGDVIKNLPIRAEELKADIQILEYSQETTPMSPQKENDLIDKIKHKRDELQNVQKELSKQQIIQTDLSDTDKAITELFQKADEEHTIVQQYYKDSQEKHEKYMTIVREISASINESNKKHQKYVEIREEAQRHHEKAMEMLSKIMSVKKDRKKRWQESKDLLKNQNVKAKKELFDKNKLKKIEEDSVESLKQGKKITL
jgi:phosphoserine phosphatase